MRRGANEEETSSFSKAYQGSTMGLKSHLSDKKSLYSDDYSSIMAGNTFLKGIGRKPTLEWFVVI